MKSVTVIGARSLFRAGLADLLGAIGFCPVEEADDAPHLRRGVGEASPPPETLMIALARSGAAAQAVRELTSWHAGAKVVCLVPAFDLDEMRACFAAGACGYVLESISRDALRESLRLVAAGEKVFASQLAVEFPALAAKPQVAAGAGGPAHPAELSNREREILQHLANGQSNKVIARSLEIAEATVKVHVKRILRKAHAVNRTQAALWAIARGVAGPPAPAPGPAPGDLERPHGAVA